jgi:hypothetical protein
LQLVVWMLAGKAVGGHLINYKFGLQILAGMVVRGISGLKEVYQQVHQKVIEKDGTVVIYACYDLDSICAAKIISVRPTD